MNLNNNNNNDDDNKAIMGLVIKQNVNYSVDPGLPQSSAASGTAKKKILFIFFLQWKNSKFSNDNSNWGEKLQYSKQRKKIGENFRLAKKKLSGIFLFLSLLLHWFCSGGQ